MDIASSTTSSMTSTSHTMTAFPIAMNPSLLPTKNPATAAAMATLLESLAPANRHAFIAPPPSLPDISLAFAKDTLGMFAGKLGEEQVDRLKEQRRKRKRGEAMPEDGQVLKIRKIHTDGFEVAQVWEQARRVIDALRADTERVLEDLGEVNAATKNEARAGNGGVELLKFDDDGFEIGSDDESLDEEQEISGPEEENGSEAEDMNGGGTEDAVELNGLDGEDEYEDEEDEVAEATDVFVQDPHGLNDGFFSIEEFNKQTEFLEQQDAAGDLYTGEASDEEEIDWDVDPLTMLANPVSSSRQVAAMVAEDVEDDEDEEMEDDEEENGPTFGDVDLNAPEGESEDGDEDFEMDEDVDLAGNNTNGILYKDFFEPPPRKAGKGERQADYLERQSRKVREPEPEDDATGIERAMADVRRDLFDDLSVEEGSEDALSDLDPSDPKSRKSVHERRQAKLAEEIRRLEAASVAKREWTLAGEARAADRPLNSLLEEDLDFERTGKPVLEVTAEVTESIEELIKRRILAQEFDEVIKRRPDSVPTNSRRGAFELDDSKPQQSLAELYEEEHVKAHNPDTYVSKADEKLRREEREIEGLWKEVSAKLDALSSWHYKPKPPVPSLTVIADVATIAMEDAQPTTASAINGGSSMLAPQEIYKAGKEKDNIEKGEIVPKSGAPVARQEMTREEKLRRRRREKERIKKRGGVELNQRPESKKAKQSRETLGELKRGGVKVIGRKGDIRDVEGNKVQAAKALIGAGGFKL